jgi:hypothetical protein
MLSHPSDSAALAFAGRSKNASAAEALITARKLAIDVRFREFRGVGNANIGRPLISPKNHSIDHQNRKNLNFLDFVSRSRSKTDCTQQHKCMMAASFCAEYMLCCVSETSRRQISHYERPRRLQIAKTGAVSVL